jgi:hypothetical protein
MLLIIVVLMTDAKCDAGDNSGDESTDRIAEDEHSLLL